MNNLWACADASVIEQIAPLCRVSPGDPSKATQPTKQGRLAIVPVIGPITAYGGYDLWRGAQLASSYDIRNLALSLARDDSVSMVLFVIDSPGGQAKGIVDLSDAIRQLSAVKPTAALIDGMAASAALFITSTVRQVIATRGSWSGSVGTYSLVLDASAAFERQGLKVHAITSSHLKVAGAFGTALTDDQKASLQRQIDALQAEFERTLAAGRKLSPDRMQLVTTGEIWPAKRAQQFGLIDTIGTMADAIKAIDNSGGLFLEPPAKAAAAPPSKPDQSYIPMPMPGRGRNSCFGAGM